MKVKAPAQLFKSPEVKRRRDRETRELTDETYMLQSLIIEGQQYDFFVDDDLTEALNGQREHLDSGEPVSVFAHLRIDAYRGRPKLELDSLEPRK